MMSKYLSVWFRFFLPWPQPLPKQSLIQSLVGVLHLLNYALLAVNLLAVGHYARVLGAWILPPGGVTFLIFTKSGEATVQWGVLGNVLLVLAFVGYFGVLAFRLFELLGVGIIAFLKRWKRIYAEH